MGLLGLVMSTALFAPSALIGIPFVLLVLALPSPGGSAWLVAAIFVVTILVPGATGGLWYVERAWAVLVGGGFAAITLWWPSSRFTTRGLAAVGAALLVLTAYFLANPPVWDMVDWLIRSKIGGDLAAFLEGLRYLDDVDPRFIATFDDFFSSQIRLYPALVSLSTFAALGVAWWLYVRLSLGRSDGLGPLRRFAFPDVLVWIVVAGVSMLLVGTAWARLVGYNTLFFMGVLYAIRGIAVVAFFKGGLSFGAVVLGGLMTLIAAPVVLGAAVMIGLGDTWLRLRARAESALGDS